MAIETSNIMNFNSFNQMMVCYILL